jgi:ABC-type branched-subunit amino acid transport system ATPase component
VTALLDTEGLELAYGELTACRNISTTVDTGEIVALDRTALAKVRYCALLPAR